MKTKNQFTVEAAEFMLSDGTSIVWRKEKQGWSVSLHKHNHNQRHVRTVSHLPSIINAQYFAKEYPLKSNENGTPSKDDT